MHFFFFEKSEYQRKERCCLLFFYFEKFLYRCSRREKIKLQRSAELFQLRYKAVSSEDVIVSITGKSSSYKPERNNPLNTQGHWITPQYSSLVKKQKTNSNQI